MPGWQILKELQRAQNLGKPLYVVIAPNTAYQDISNARKDTESGMGIILAGEHLYTVDEVIENLKENM